MKIYGFVYITTCLENGKIYIGQTTNWKDASYKGSGELFRRALKKYGKNKFKRRILRICYSQKELNTWEYVFIKKYKSQDKSIGYNIAEGDVLSSEHNPAKLPEVREKMSRAKKGRESSFKGKHLSSEAKRKISDKKRGRKMSESFREKMRIIGKERGGFMSGKHHTEKTKERLSEIFSGKGNPMYGVHLNGEKNGMYGKKQSEETKRKISESQKRRLKLLKVNT